ncbi:MAG: hypothetical protein IT365_25055 [Candidatus Hydrogenedentes bacterium]|nr:hypothetical protein [Candidatus Hydrogenedentota bacterium]
MRVSALLLCILGLAPATLRAEESYLAPRNTEVPFPYLCGATRAWPILAKPLPADAHATLTAREGDHVLAQGSTLSLNGLRIALAENGFLQIAAESGASKSTFQLDVSLALPGGTETQTLTIQPGPPTRPLSYLADFGDDLIRIFNAPDGTWRPVTKDAFDQYFRRCQVHGVNRLILWLSPMPYIVDPGNYAPEDWARYEAQAKALNESPAFQQLIAERLKGAEEGHWGRHIPWDWIRQLNTYRLMRDFGPLLSQSAVDHGIRLTVSFRPFETALTKYYELPAFDERGAYLWGFLPMATPVVNYRTDATCFAHYRTILRQMGHEDKGRLGRITVQGVENADVFLARFKEKGDNLRIEASDYPPLQHDSLVLQRQADGRFVLAPFASIAQQAAAHRQVLTGFDLRMEDGALHIGHLDVPFDTRFLILSNPSSAEEALTFPALKPVELYARAGNRIGRENVYWVLDGDSATSAQTHVPGIPKTGEQATEFNATETGARLIYESGESRLALKERLLVIDLGAPYSVEMLDLNRAEARDNAVKEMKTLLDLPAVDELFVNTRSHVQLAAYEGDGAEGIRPLVYYRQNRKSAAHLGIDRAYAPLAVADDPVLREWAADPLLVERITTWQPGEWDGDCQSPGSPFRWRFARNQAVAAGVRALLQDFEAAFPGVRTRVVIPMGAESAKRVKDTIAVMQRPDGTPYGPGYNGVWSTINHIHSIGEGMAMLDLTGLHTEPVLFGVRDVPEMAPFRVHLEESFRDLATNRGSEFRGPRSFFFEAQYTLRRNDYDAARKERESLICEVLSHSGEINEVILYEAADWLYYLPFSDLELSGNYFVERCESARGE